MGIYCGEAPCEVVYEIVPIPPPDFRIVHVSDQYLLQRKGLFGWNTLSGYHRGAPGWYAYQYCTAMNPYYHLKYSIPEVLREDMCPTLSKNARVSFWLRRPSRIKKRNIIRVVDNSYATASLNAHLKSCPDITNPHPPADRAFS